MTGDFNAPKDELADGTIIPWRHDLNTPIANRWQQAERNILQGLTNHGMIDVFRDQHCYRDLNILDVSHATQTDNPTAVSPGNVEGKRFDHLIASLDLNPQACWYDQEGFSCSDHAPLRAKFGISSD